MVRSRMFATHSKTTRGVTHALSLTAAAACSMCAKAGEPARPRPEAPYICGRGGTVSVGMALLAAAFRLASLRPCHRSMHSGCVKSAQGHDGRPACRAEKIDSSVCGRMRGGMTVRRYQPRRIRRRLHLGARGHLSGGSRPSSIGPRRLVTEPQAERSIPYCRVVLHAKRAGSRGG